jgi:hypothetical protein
MNRLSVPAGVRAGLCVVVSAIAAAVSLNVHAEKGRADGPGSTGDTRGGERASLAAIPRPGGWSGHRGGIAGGGIAGTSYTTGFEPAEGFAPGHVDGQAGWTTFESSSVEAHIDTVNPETGVQHLRISKDPALGFPVDVGAFSPNLGVFEGVSATMSVDVNITALSGAQYEIQPQTPTQELRVTNIQFRRTGDIWAQTDAGFEDTGADWVPGVYRNLTIVLDVDLGTIETFYDGVSIHSTAIFAGDAIQEVVITGNNANAADDGDFDNFAIAGGPLPTGACCNFDGQSGCQIMDPDACLAAGGFYLGNEALCDACPMGACCNFDGDNGCEVMTPYECASYADAFYLGNDTLCGDCPPVPDSCGPGSGDCFSDNGTPGCEDIECCALVCDAVPLCCINPWNQVCADIAGDVCYIEPGCGVQTMNDCFEAQPQDPGSPYCSDTCGGEPCAGCCENVCEFDPYCCDTNWDDLCAGEAEAVCGCTPQDVPPNDDCANAIPLTLGTTPVTNLCATAGGPAHGSCNDDGWTVGLGLDVWYTWTSDFDGVITIEPSVPDGNWETQLAMYEGCDCQALEDPPYACATSPGNDQTADTATLVAPVTNGTCYIIRLGGTIDGSSGEGTLTLSAAPAVCVDGVGDCNTAHGGLGCADPTCCVQVCTVDPSCCDTAWDAACASLAAQLCPPYECPGIDVSPATLEEPEACGEDLNGGCNTIPDPPVFTDVVSGDIVHGTAWADADTRDTDWYRLTVTAQDDVNQNGVVEVHYNLQSELPLISFLIDDQNNPPGCVDTDGDGAADGLDTPGTTGYGQSCVQVQDGVAGVEAPGEYYVWVGTGDSGGGSIFDGYPCSAGAAFGNDYLLCVNITDDGEPFDPTCPPQACPWDCESVPSGDVGVNDFLAMLGQWGSVGTSCDFDGGGVGVTDFLELLGNWGPCP